MESKIFYRSSVLLICLSLISIPQPYAQQKLEAYLEIELKRLEETFRLLDTFAEQIWPGWDNYMDAEFQGQFPNLVFLLIGPRKEIPEGYELIPGITVRGKKVYINRKEELPIKIEPPLTGGGGGGLIIRMRLRERKIPSEYKKEGPYFPSSDTQILLYIHEFYHALQRKAWKDMTQGGGDRNFTVNTEYATYSEIEGQALLEAYCEKDDAKALEYLKDYIVAREINHKYMAPGAIQFELHRSVTEGTATYSDTKMTMLIQQEGYEPKMSQQDNPFFFGFQYLNNYIAFNTTGSINPIMNQTLDTLDKYYTYGAYQCLLLDRFVEGWKRDFFQNNKNLDQVMADFLRLSEDEEKLIAGRIKSKYKFDELYAKHSAVIKERDDAIALVKSRVGKRYIVDVEKTREFFKIIPRGKSVRIRVEQIFPQGIEKLTLGEVGLVSSYTPIHRPWLWTVEWVNTEAKEGENGYELKYREKVGDNYKHITFICDGFTLVAPEVQIKENEDEVRIIVLSKVTRGN